LRCRAGAGGGDATLTHGRRDGAGGVVRCRDGRGRAPAADDPPPGGGRGVVADPGARPGGRVGGGCGRQEARAGGGRNVAAGLGAAAGGGRAREPRGRGGCGLRRPSVALADGGLDRARDTIGTAGQLTLTLPAAVTGPLLGRVPAAFHGGINEVLLTGLAGAVARSRPARGPRS